MRKVPYAHPIRKVPRKFHKFVPILSSMGPCNDDNDYCDECMANFAAIAESQRPGHVWAVDHGRVIFLEDKIAESMLGRPLNPDETVVHRDSNVLNNTRANLEVVRIPNL
jgi:hypothetical protein